MLRRLTTATLALSVLLFCAGLMAHARTLTLEDRIAAQEAIERVYYSHRIGAEIPFEEAVPRDALQRKVVRYLKQSVALGRYWKTPVTDEMLKRELIRMSRGTRMPERLAQLFAALDHDPILIRECLARPTLVARLTRDFYTFDTRFHVAARREADALHEALSNGVLDPREEHARRSEVEQAREPDEAKPEQGLGPVDEVRDAFVVRVLLDQVQERSNVVEYRVPKVPLAGWWNDVAPHLDAGAVATVARAGTADSVELENLNQRVSCVDDDTWDNGTLDDQPPARRKHLAVWTGTEMIVWGGQGDDGVSLGDGWRYDPAVNSWTEMSTVDAPSPRTRHAAVWTGSEMLVWGGTGFPPAEGAGGRYDPWTDSWTAMSIVDAPAPRTGHTAVWTGTHMLVWGGRESQSAYLNTGGRYDPSTDSWTATSIVDVPAARHEHTAIWTGSEMIVWGGSGGVDSTGGRYDPSTDSWAATSTVDAPSPAVEHTAVWTGSEMLVWGTDSTYNPTPPPPGTGARYDPATDSWTAISTVDAPSVRKEHTAVWSGTEMIVWGGYYEEPYPENYWWSQDTGGRYDPSTDSWAPTSLLNSPAPRGDPHTAVWTGAEMIVWGGGTNTGGRYDPSTDSWRPSSPAPDSRDRHSAVWTGSHMVIWGGSYYTNTGGLYDPATDSWSVTTTAEAPSGRIGHEAFWTGSRMLIWGGSGAYPAGAQNSGGLYDPLNDAWTATTTVGAPAPSTTGYLAVWTGTQMIAWRPSNNTGGRYDPLSDSWTTMATEGAPESGASAVWTGTQMIVWHGGSITGGLYDPLSDSWAPISTENAPSPRSWYEAVWAGDRMLIWGGNGGGWPHVLDTGGSYDPVTDSWTAISTVDAPAARLKHTIVSTGEQMLVWGGCDDSDCDSYDLLDSGGRYDPLSDTWTAMSTVGAPAPRYQHTAVWAGSYMLVWGGRADWYAKDSGGRYALGHASDDDGDGLSECDGDCNDGTPLVYPWAPELCDGFDNQCPGEFGHGHVDVGCNSDGDGYCAAEMVTIGFPATCPRGGGDCNDINLYVYPGAPEVNDGIDNQCPGDPGYGVIDETSGNSGFHDPNDKSEYSWPAQPGAVQYEVVRSGRPDFYSGCTFLTTMDTSISAEDPEVGETQFYLVRPVAPRFGSWGQDSSLQERFPPCASGVASINFQPEHSALPAWHKKDWGQAFDEELGYGWSVPITGNTRERDLLAEQQLDTFVFSQVVREWNLALPVGTYAIDFISGDAAYPQGPQQVVVEGITAMDGVTMPAGEFWAISVCADVGDGNVTIEIGGQAGNTILNSMFVEPESCAPGTVIVRGIFTP